MTEILELNGKTYLPASQAARKIGVTRDYVGRLCREGKIVGRRVGPTWYVEAGSLDELLVSQQYVKAKRAQELSGKRVVEYRAHQADALAPEVSEESAANSLVRISSTVVPPVVSEVVANVPRHILETQQNVAESLRAAGRRVGASPSARAFLEHAPRAVYPTVHAVAQYSNLAHRLFALAFAFAFTFGAYGFVDAQYRTVAIDTAHQGVLALSALPEYAQHVAIDSEAAARNLLALRPSKDEMLASAVSVATLTNTGVQYLQGIWNRAITDTASLTRSLIARMPKRDPNSDASVFAEIVASKPKVAALTEQRSGATTVINHPVVERIREIERTVQTTVGGISAQALADSLQQLDNKLSSEIAFVSASGNATYQVVAQTNRIDQLSGTDLTNITVHGVSGLAASDIPALSYFAATSTISVAYGGTGTSTVPTYGKMLVGNSVGGYDLLATSTLGVTSSQWTTSGSDIYYNTGNVSVGTTTLTGKLNVAQSGTASANSYGLYLSNTATTSVDSLNKYGLYLTSTGTWNGMDDKNYGLFVDTPTGGESNYAAVFKGNVGVNNTSPSVTLDVNYDDGVAAGEHQIAYINGNNAYGVMFGYRADGVSRTAGFLRSFTSDLFIGAGASGGQAVVIKQDTGEFGIGSTTPLYKLSVEGSSSLGNQAIAGYFTATSSNTSSFAGGLTAFASSTIGAGTQTTGLTISGGATTTGNLYVASSAVFGSTNHATGTAALAQGATNNAGGIYSLALGGSNNFAYQALSAIIGGANNIVNGQYSGIFGGSNSVINGNYSSVINGSNTTVSGTNSTAIGASLTISGDNSFGVGLGGGTYAITANNVAAFLGGNVGIGTTSPSTALSIVPSSNGGIKIDGSTASSISPQVHLNLSSTIYGVFSVAAAANGGLTGSAAGDVILKNNQNNDLLFGTTNSERMRITSAGNVGIGTTTPDAQLTISGTGQTTAALNTASSLGGTLKLLDAGGAVGNGGAVLFGATSQPSAISKTFASIKGLATALGNNGTGDIAFSVRTATTDATLTEALRVTSAGSVGIASTTPWGLLSVNPTSAMGTAPSFVIGSSTATKFIVDNAGNVGIGTETPSSILSLYQAATTTLALTNSQFKSSIIGRGTNVDFFGGGNTTEQQFPLARISALNQYNGSGSYRADLAFLTQSSNAAPVEAMRITSAGNVGIGTTTPDARLDVSASASTQANGLYTTAIFRADSVNSGFLTIESGANSSAVESRYSALQAHSNYLSNGYTAYRNLVLNASGGNVGIGTTTPAQKLDVMGSIYSRDQSNDALIYMDAKSGNYGRIQAANNADTVVKNLALQPSGGNVGIGSASPNSLLSVGGGDYFQVDTTGIIYQNVSSATYDVWIQGSAPGTASGDTRNLALIGNATGDDLILNFNTEYDCVSVGGTSCAYALDVAGAGNFTGDVNVATTNTDPAGNNVVGVHLDSLGYISANRSAGVAGYFGRTADGAIVGFTSAGTVEGYISISGATVSYGAFTGSHYALLSGDASRGELMTLTGDNKNYHNDPESEVLYGIERSTKENDPQILGAYLALLEPTDPRSVENPDQVMAVGNGDMWVVDRGEDLQPGDYLVSSAVPGHAEKDPEADPVSYIIARVAEPVQWGSATSTINGVKHKKVSVFFENFTRSNGVDLASLIASSTASTTPVSDALIDQFFTNVFARVTTWLADATNGVGSVFAQAFHAKQEICVDDQCLTKDDVHALLQLAHGQVAAAAGNSGSSGQVVGGSGGQATTTDPTADTTPPTITLTGASSITIAIGDTYSDLGATVTDNVNNNLGYTISLDGATSTTPDQLSLDTTTAGTHTILFSATDQAGNTGTATRTVIVGDESPVNSEQQTDNSGGNTATTTPPVSDATATSTDTSTSSGPVIVPDSDGTTTPATS